MPVEQRSFTKLYGKSANKLLTPVAIKPILTDKEPVKLLKAVALWDTGATMTCIQPSLLDRLCLRLCDTTDYTVINSVGGKFPSKPTLVSIYFSHNFIMEYCTVYVVELPEYADILIGMDIISLGDFAICNAEEETSFSFAMPPSRDRVDFTKPACNNRSD